MVRIHAHIYGKVQGVFFRLSTQKVALTAGVSGWVRNRPDGSVEAVFEGDQTAVDTVLEWCRKGPENAHVESVISETEPFSNRYEGFTVRT